MTLLIWATIIFCSGYYFSITSTGSGIALVILLACFCCIVLFNSRQKNLFVFKGRELLFLLVFLLAVLLSEFCNGHMLGLSTIKQILTILIAYFIVKTVSWNDFTTQFVKAMLLISVLATIGYALALSPLASMFPRIVNYNDVEYLSGGFFAAINNEYLGVSNRMQGLFWEPGLFASYLALAILFCKRTIFATRFRYIFTLVFFSVCLVLTRSGAGLLLLPIALLVKIIGASNKKFSKVTLALLFAFLLGLAYVFMSQSATIDEFLEYYLYSKLFDSENISNAGRWNAIVVDLKIFFENLLFGVGHSGYALELEKYTADSASSGTSTLTAYLAYYGIFGIPMVAAWLRGLIKFVKKKHLIVKTGTFLVFLLILTKEPHGGLLFMNCILMYFLTNKAFRGEQYDENQHQALAE